MPDYQKGKIYTLRTYYDDSLIYVGSTCCGLSNRLAQHKSDYKRFQNGKKNYITSFKIVCYDNCYIELYEAYPCDNKSELIKREGEVIRELDCVNKAVAGRSNQEYRNENKDEIKLKKKKHYQNNKDEIKFQKKKYYQNNRDRFLEQQKKYREDNKDKIKLKMKQRVICECGADIVKYTKHRHIKSKKHIKLMKDNEETESESE